MPRDASGNYTLPAGNPVVNGTLIESVWANSTLSDIATQLNGVVTRDGLLGPSDPFKLVDGTAMNPGLSFSAQPGLGLYRKAADTLAFARSGTELMSLNTTDINFGTKTLTVGGISSSGGFSVTGVSKVGDGTVAAPAYSFNSEAGLGMYRNAAGVLGFATSGGDGLKIAGARVDVLKPLFTNNNAIDTGGGNITTTGSIIAGGIGPLTAPLGTLYGGTGATSATNARTNLAVPGLSTSNAFTGNQKVNPSVLGNKSGAFTADFTSTNVIECTLTGNATITLSAPAGSFLTLIVRQDSTGSRTITWTNYISMPAGSAINPAANSYSVVSLYLNNAVSAFIGNILQCS